MKNMKSGSKVVGLNGGGFAAMTGVVVDGEPRVGQFGDRYILVRWTGTWAGFGESWVRPASVVQS
jgi:hypothetical protein